ncbi:HNH endonuclease [Actinomadura sp. NPDC048032]|uniref:HNH endonuclease n=1 Tax=Actinomadura sp. NPDC048032 TaxID=3155747 RepID=UPI00340DD3F5
MSAWVLVCNPKVFRLGEMLQDGGVPAMWTIGRYRDMISPGEPVVLWQSGPSGGATAIGEVAGHPHQTWETADAHYWVEGEAPTGVRWVVPITVTHTISPPITREAIKAEPTLAASTLLTQPFASNPHHWTDEQWKQFKGLAAVGAHDLVSRSNVVPRKRNPNWTWDEVVLACDALARNNWKPLEDTDPRAVELSRILRRLPIHAEESRDARFRSSSSVRRKTADLATQHPAYKGKPTNGGETDRKVLRIFLDDPDRMAASAQIIREGALLGTFAVPDLADTLEELETSAPEGRLLFRRHLVRERDRGLRTRKIAHARKSNPDLACEACGFSFIQTYGHRGADYIECHHVIPLHASGETSTKLEDLALLCANCHRMIHRAAPWPTPVELRDLIERTRQSRP